MPEPNRRATRVRIQARNRSRYLAERIGRSLFDARTGSRRLQREIAVRAGISQPFYSKIERGGGARASLETLAACALACDTQLAAFLEALPGATLPRDIEHVRRQQAVISLATGGGWRATPELPIDPEAARSRSVDVFLERRTRLEAAIVEIVDLVTDVGGAFRGHADKVNAARRAFGPEWRVAGLLVVRGTSRNRALIRDLGDVIGARYPASSVAWLDALRNPQTPMPDADGFAWTGATSPDLRPARLRRPVI
jgi:transcriptional regulator with XRE-family HTH domain